MEYGWSKVLSWNNKTTVTVSKQVSLEYSSQKSSLWERGKNRKVVDFCPRERSSPLPYHQQKKENYLTHVHLCPKQKTLTNLAH